MRKLISALVVWILVSLGMWVLAKLFGAVNSDVTQSIAAFLDTTNIVIGLLAGLWYFFFGPTTGRFA